jgi:hypothetical protein
MIMYKYSRLLHRGNKPDPVQKLLPLVTKCVGVSGTLKTYVRELFGSELGRVISYPSKSSVIHH